MSALLASASFAAETEQITELRVVLTELEARMAQNTSASSPKSVSEAKAFVSQTRKDLADLVYDEAEAQWQLRIAHRLLKRFDYRHITVDVQTPGTLGDLILGQVENFADVEAITIKGTLNDADLDNLKDRMLNLKDLDMSQANLSALPNSVFSDHQNLQWVYLPQTLEKIGQSAFNRCSSLFNIEFPASLKTIQYAAFSECDSLREVILNEGLTTLESSAFNSCDCNKRIVIPKSLESILSHTFFYNIALEELELNNGLKSIGSNAFAYCRKLKAVKFYEGLQRIEDNSFYYCDSLTEVTLPSTLIRADASPFDYCDQLTTVRCLSILPPRMDDQIPYGCSMEGRTLYVPAVSLAQYKQSRGWDKFPTILPMEEMPETWTVWNEDREVSRVNIPKSLPANYRPEVMLSNNLYYYNDAHQASLYASGDGTLHAHSLSFNLDWSAELDNEWGYYYGVGSPHNNGYRFSTVISDAPFRTDNLKVTLWVRNDRWFFISLPFDMHVSDLKSDDDCDFVIHKYNGAARAQADFSSTWPQMTADSLLHAGEGFILQCTNAQQNYTTFSINVPASGATLLNKDDVVIRLNPCPASLNENRGWNLVANPYLCYFDTRALSHRSPITVWDNYYCKYRAFSPIDDQYILRPTEAFFLQCPVDATTLTFDKQGRQSNRFVIEEGAQAAARGAEQMSSRTLYNLILKQHEEADRTRVVINPAALTSYELACDASKMPAMNPQLPEIATMQEEVVYAINERPLADGQVRLRTYLPAAGQAMIALESTTAESGAKVWLEDRLMGKMADLTESDYQYEAAGGVEDQRFVLHLSGEVSGLHAIEAKQADEELHYYGLDGRKLSQPIGQGIYLRQQGTQVQKIQVR